MKKKILATIILMIFCTLAFCQCVKAETEVKTTIQIKKNATSWTGISVSDAYDKCQELNNDNSALGTTGDNVMAHLSTNADWYAVSLLAYSDYGSKNNANTTGNNSGIMNFGVKSSFTSGILKTNTTTENSNYQSLINNKETKFVEKIENATNRESNKSGLGFRSSEILIGSVSYGDDNGYPISIRSNLFDIRIGKSDGWGIASGAANLNNPAVFRPAIWVK